MGAGRFLQMLHHGVGGIPDSPRVCARRRRRIAVVHENVIVGRRPVDLGNTHPHEGVAARIPLFYLVLEQCAAGVDEAQIVAGGTGLRVVEIARVELYQHGKVREILQLSRVVEVDLLSMDPARVPPAEIESGVLVDGIEIIVSYRQRIENGNDIRGEL